MGFIYNTVATPFQFVASGYPAASFSTSSALPTGVTLTSAGILSGTPLQSGTFTLAIVAGNGVGTTTAAGVIQTGDEGTVTIRQAGGLHSAFVEQKGGDLNIAWGGADRPVLIVRGQANLLDDSAVGDLDRVRQLLDELETKQDIAGLLDSAREGSATRIFIGSENKLFSLSGSSLIVAPFHDDRRKIVGVLGVIGPVQHLLDVGVLTQEEFDIWMAKQKPNYYVEYFYNKSKNIVNVKKVIEQ